MLLSYSDNRTAPATVHRDWPARLLLTAVALGGTLAYAASFRASPAAGQLAGAAACVGLAAGLAWPAFGAVLLLVTSARPSVLDWADACLRAMASGVVVLALAAALNLNVPLLSPGADAAAWLPFAHVALLVAGNVVMYATFRGEARALGMTPATAAVLWALVLDGTFILVLMFLYGNGAM